MRVCALSSWTGSLEISQFFTWSRKINQWFFSNVIDILQVIIHSALFNKSYQLNKQTENKRVLES